MGSSASLEIDAWLRGGGLVVTASERAARALAAAFHRARRAEGLSAWPAPNILDWKSFVGAAWEERTLAKADGRLVLNSAQEQSLWAEIAGAGGHMATLLEGPRHRLAGLAMEAHELLAAYAPRFLRDSARRAWDRDAAEFGLWLTAFDDACRKGGSLSPARLPLELMSLLELETGDRQPLLLAGFDRILPTQRALFDAWGGWTQTEAGEPAAQVSFHQAADSEAELAACAIWCARRLIAQPGARLLVVTQAATTRRGEIERAFLKHTGTEPGPLFEFSLGVPLIQVALPKAAQLLLRWLCDPLAEHEVDWLLSSGYAAEAEEESAALQSHMRSLRRHSLQQPDWTLAAFVGQPPGTHLPGAWIDRMREAQRYLNDLARQTHSPFDWAEVVPRVLKTAGWPGGGLASGSLSSGEYQAARRWQQAVEIAGSLGYDGRRIRWKEFLTALSHTVEETLFAPESRDAPIQIAGAAESAGLSADAVWFLGATEDAWPARGTTHPLIPPDVQRETGMPHATAQLDWDLAHAIATRLIASAPEVHFSYAKQDEGTEARPSRLIEQLAGKGADLPLELKTQSSKPPMTEVFADSSRIPFPPGKVSGGASVLSAQSQCPFKAFATARLGAQSWEPAEAGLTAAQRGQLLHAVLHSVWAGPPHGIRTHAELQGLDDRQSFVRTHVHDSLQTAIGATVRQRMPRRYLELEENRLARLVTEWLDYEATRIAFEVAETEAGRTIHLAGLTFNLRLDRVDRLNDASLLVIDYKSGDVSPKSWDLPRPDDVQLPLYAGFALNRETEELGGLVFAKVRAGDQAFAGRVFDAKATLLPNIPANSGLARDSFSIEQLIDWREYIEQLARNFVDGHAEVDPREYPLTCERCGLQTLCRISENQGGQEGEEDLNDEEAADE